MKYIAASVQKELARRRLRRRAWWRSVAVAGPSPDEPGGLPRLELVWLPSYRMVFALEGARQGRQVEVLVSACDGSFRLCAMSGTLQVGELPEGESLPVVVPADEAQTIAREQLLAVLLRAPGWRRQMAPGPLRECDVIHYPYWIDYFARRRGLLDVRILDAVNGERTGGKMKAAFLAALARV